MTSTVLRLALVLFTVHASAPTRAGAQEAGPQPTEVTPAGEEAPRQATLVTGSRIRRDRTSAAPLKVIGRDQIRASGKLTVGDFLQTLVEQSNAVNTAVSHPDGNEGSTTVNLRGLSSERTLVLVNGRRTVSGRTTPESSIDVSSVPLAAIERIEILEGAASAVYGSDAIGGVVNLITRKDFTGAEVSAATGISGQGDGTAYDVSLGTGVASTWGRLAFTGGFYQQGDVLAGDRAFSSVGRAYSVDRGEYTYGSSITPQGRFEVSVPGVTDPSATALYNELVTAYPTASAFVYDPSAPAGWRPYQATDAYDQQAEGYLISPQRRIQLYATGDARLGDVARAYVETSYARRQSKQLLSAYPLSTEGTGFGLSAESMYNPFGIDLPLVTRRLVEAGGRRFEVDVDSWRVVGGVDGSFDLDALGGWAWDVSLDYGRNDSTHEQDEIYLPAIEAALGPSAMVDGQPTCFDALGGNAILGCVPLDVFGGPGSITPEQLSAFVRPMTWRGNERLLGIHAGVSGELFTLAADRPAALALGYEYRRLSGAYVYTMVTVDRPTGERAGSYHANEGYAEISLPIVSGAPFVEELEATAATRLSAYDTFGLDWRYQLGLRWKIIPDLTFRGTYATGMRAPSITDLYYGQHTEFPITRDPCTTEYGAQCAAEGAATDDPTAHHLARVGGNPELEPETATTLTVGLVVEPPALEGLSITVDYYRIAVDDVVGQLGAPLILESCYASTTPRYCDLVERDASGYITAIYDLNQNAGSLDTDGIDLGVRWALPTAVGRFGFGLDANWLRAFDRTLPDGTVVHGKGTFDLASNGIGGVYPALRFGAGVSYDLEGLTAAASMRYVGSFEECGNPDGTFEGAGRCWVDSTHVRTVGAYQVYDVYLAYALDTAAGRTLLGVGVDNLLDREPERIYNGFAVASDPTAYDFMGRYVFARVVQTF